MKLIVFSDTHGSARQMLTVVAREPSAEGCFFLGDGSSDAHQLKQTFPNLPLYAVSGNCDYTGRYPTDEIIELGGVKIFYTHGHMLGVKTGMSRLWKHAKSLGAAVALFGHTHIPCYEYLNGIHLFNPGSLCLPRGGAATYGEILIENGQPLFDIVKY